MTKKWEIYQKNEKEIKEIAKKYEISELLASILVSRNIGTEEEIRIFLEPTRDDFHDPFLFQDMEKAVKRMIEAINRRETVLIYGDYDVDGITSTTVLKRFLQDRLLDAKTYIPNRLEEGYGLNKQAIDEISKEKADLIITVDCGISSVEEVEYAKQKGMDVIITDHHETLEELPKAIAVIDAKRKDNTYPFRGLAGVGVVFKLIQAISIKMGLEEKEYLKYLDLVCIGTISDIVPLINENRVIAKLGLKLIEVSNNAGIRYLVAATGYKKVDSNMISFGVAPRINACGRMGHQEEALKLFLTQDPKEAQEITKTLNKYNKKRQDTEKKIFEEALKVIKKRQLDQKQAIVLGGKNWHHGVIGIVSSKITELYFKPSILVCFEGEEAKGSGRSIPGFDLHDALCQCGDYLEKYGGHEMAVGLTLKTKNFDSFQEKFEAIAKQSHLEEIEPILYIDGVVELKDMKKEVVKELSLLEPFGEQNRVPLFLYKNLKIDSIRALSEGKHLKLTLKDTNYKIDGIGFNLGNLVEEYRIGDKIDIVGILEMNDFNGNEAIQINIKDIRKSYEK